MVNETLKMALNTIHQQASRSKDLHETSTVRQNSAWSSGFMSARGSGWLRFFPVQLCGSLSCSNDCLAKKWFVHVCPQSMLSYSCPQYFAIVFWHTLTMCLWFIACPKMLDPPTVESVFGVTQFWDAARCDDVHISRFTSLIWSYCTRYTWVPRKIE